MKIVVMGEKWELKMTAHGLGPNEYGECPDPRDKKSQPIKIRPGMSPRQELDTVIHELLHAGAYKLLSEEWVNEFAQDVARVLWKMGWRKTGDE